MPLSLVVVAALIGLLLWRQILAMLLRLALAALIAAVAWHAISASPQAAQFRDAAAGAEPLMQTVTQTAMPIVQRMVLGGQP